MPQAAASAGPARLAAPTSASRTGTGDGVIVAAANRWGEHHEHIKAVGNPKLTLETCWQRKKGLAVWEDD